MSDEKKSWIDGKYAFPLSKPIDAFGDKVDTLTLREPTGGDIMAIGNPVEFDPISDPPRIKIDDTRMGNMIARLANVPPSSLRSMVPKDMINLGWILSNFFMPI